MQWSLIELINKRTDELIDPDATESYYAVGKQLGCLPLGMMADAQHSA